MTRSIRPLGPAVGLLVLALAGCASTPADRLDAGQRTAQAQPGCPPNPTGGGEASPPERGCWNRANLARMLADPADLNQGRSLGPAAGDREAVIVDSYRRGENRPAASQNTARPTLLIGGPSGGGGR